MKKKALLISSSILLVLALAGVSEAEPAAVSDAKPQLVSDDQYEYEYDADGRCTALHGAGNATFTYEYDQNGNPVSRMLNGMLYEEYEYDENGELSKLTVYDGEEPTIWIYENGLAKAVINSPYVEPTQPAFVYNSVVEFEWDEAGRLTSAKSWGAYDEASVLSQSEYSGLSQEEIASYLSEMSPEKAPYTDDYVMEKADFSWEYDENGRVTKYSISQTISALEAYTRWGKTDSVDSTTVRSYAFDYSDGQMQVTAEQVKKGDPDTVIMQPTAFDYEITYNADGLPASVNGIDADIYSQFSCDVTSAEIGYWGITWNETAVNYYGELHGGPLGIYFDDAYISTGRIFFMKVTGTDADGRTVEYLLTPDDFGRQSCIKTADGLFVMPCSTEIDLTKRNTLFINSDEDVYVYR